MRLRLTIRRHALPETNIIWDAASAEHLTISNLLEQINQVIPLESAESNWGLEDYAVELPGYSAGFECLHFGVVGKVFRDDDEVVIRPLLTQDAKMRRESGRRQISEDGMVLIDGVPFGKARPVLGKRIRRPEVSIPPLKRRRIMYDADESEEELSEDYANGEEEDEGRDRQLVLKEANFDDDDEEDDVDFNPGDDGGEEGEEDDEDSNLGDETNGEDMVLDGDEDDDHDHEDDAESSAAEEENPLFEYYDKHGLPKGSIKSGRALEHMAKALGGSSNPGAMRKARPKDGQAGSSKKVVFDDIESFTEGNVDDTNPPAVPESKDVEKDTTDEESSSGDSDDESSSDESSDEDEDSEDSDDDAPKGPGADVLRDNDSSADEGDSSDSSSGSDSSSDSGSDSSSGSASKSQLESDLDSDSHSDSDSDSDSDSPPEEVSSKLNIPGTGNSLNIKPNIPKTTSIKTPEVSQKPKGPALNDISNIPQPSSMQAPKIPSQPTVPPYQGTSATKSRNQRRRNTNALRRMQDKGIVPAGTTLEDYNNLGLKKVTTMDEAQGALKAKMPSQSNMAAQSEVTSEVTTKSAKASKANAEFEARRKQLLESLASGGVEVGSETPKVPPRTVQESGDVEMGNTGSSILHENQAGGPKEVATAMAKVTLAASSTSEGAGNDMESLTPTPRKSHAPYNPPSGKKNCLKDMTFVFTGQLEGMSRNQARELVAKYGGKVVQNPSPKTNYVVLGANVGETKLRKLEKMKLDTISKEKLFELIAKSGSPSGGESTRPSEEIPETPASEAASASNNQTPNTPSETPGSDRRSKLDVNAGRRMLFGALGIKNPKTKADEEKVRSNLMKLVRPVRPVAESVVPEVQHVEEDPDAWREKINLRAEECCHDGVVLSEPPFPFVQRWDPQQQGSWATNGRGGKRKKNKRNKSQYNDDEPLEGAHQRKRQKSWNYEEYDESFNVEEGQNDGYRDGVELSYDEPAQADDDKGYSKAKEGGHDTQATDMEDLQPLPEDLTTLAKLNAGDAKAGTIIAFKHLVMGPNYQPQYSEYKTAVVLRVDEPEHLELSLALRDREQKEYDPDTGERIFGQFEMPVDDDADEEDDGGLSLEFAELVDPLVVQIAPDNILGDEDLEPANDTDQGQDHDHDGGDQTTSGQESNNTPADSAKEASGEKHASTDNSTTLDHEQAAHSPEKSGEGEASLDQDSPIKSIEDNIEEGVAKKSANILTEDLLQKSADGSFLEVAGEADMVEDPETPSLKNATEHPAVGEGDRMDVYGQAGEPMIEETSLGKEQLSTSRSPPPNPVQQQSGISPTPTPASHINDSRSPHATPSQKDASEHHEVEVQGTSSEQNTPRLNENLTALSRGDSSNDRPQQDEMSTPRPSSRSNAENVAQSSPHSITESARHDVSIMMREAGFRSDIPSSILRSNQLNVQDTPGDAAVFEKLMREMAPDTDRIPYSSPQFKGFASSSPIKAHGEQDHIEMSPTPVSWEKPTFQSQQSIAVQADSQSSHNEPSSIKYPKLQDLSSYTSPGDHGRQPDLISHAGDSFHPFEEFDSLVNRQDEESSMLRAEAEAEEFPSAQPGRDSESIPQDLPNLSESQPLSKLDDTPPPVPEPQSPVRRSPSPKLPVNRRASSGFFTKDVKKKKKKVVTPEPVSDFFPSSDSDMPTLQEILSQPRRIKSEPGTSQPQSQPPKSKVEEEYEADMAKYDAMYDSDQEDVKVPIASQTSSKLGNRTSSFQKPALIKKEKETRRASASQVPRMSQQPRPSQSSRLSQAPKFSQPPRASQPPQGSQMIGLTLSSSDVEPEPEFSTAPDDVEVYHDEERDSDYQYTGPMGSGWTAKKGTSVTTRGKSLEPARVRRVTGGDGGFESRRVSSTQDIQSTKWAGGKGRRGEGVNGVKEEGRRTTTYR